jgi:hypothetical protein
MISVVARFRRNGSALALIALAITVLCSSLWAQDPEQPVVAESTSRKEYPPIATVHDKWKYFVQETTGPLTFGGAAFNAGFSQATKTDPQYGNNGVALAKRFGASLADISTDNFFGDFVTASVFREDPRYYRMGEAHGFWRRAGYAISRAVVIRKDSGGNQFNFDNILGSAASAGMSNLYYPSFNRSGNANLMHFGITAADNGFVNLAPEFWPDFRRKVFGWIH